ncbi:MAG: hypothetical protein ACOYIK_02050 [Coriobacteriales bacterium]|jgi:hypothetical protein
MFATENLNLTREWDKTFAKSDKVEHEKVTLELIRDELRTFEN